MTSIVENTGVDIQASMAQRNKAALQNINKKLEAAIGEGEMKKIDEKAKEFEAVFMAEMLKPMFSGIKTDPVFGGGPAEDSFKGIMLQEYGKVMAEAGGIGIADHVKAELLRIQQETRQ